jgi:alkylation response protein AidB-like acyl-CoA dehydrogenase
MFGSEPAKAEYLPPITAGEDCMSIAMSEPGAGSDLRSMETVAEPNGDGYVVSGEKTWVGFVKWASAAVIWTKVPEGIGSMIVDLDAPGVEVVEHHTNMAGHTQTHFRLDDVEVPRSNVLTDGRAGFKEQLKALNWERLSASVGSNIIAAKALDYAQEFASEREAGGKPIREHQAIGHKLATMSEQLTASRVLTFQCATEAERRGRVPDPMGATMAKLFSSEILEEVATASLQVHGARGYMQGHPVEYLYRLARGRRIAGGTDEVLKNTIHSMLERNEVPSPVTVARDRV